LQNILRFLAHISLKGSVLLRGDWILLDQLLNFWIVNSRRFLLNLYFLFA
jgi:hypothetical protein